jgi:hypothetical protein
MTTPTSLDSASDDPELRSAPPRWLILVGALLLLLLIGLLCSWGWAWFNTREGRFYTGDPAPTPLPVFSETPLEVGFAELNADPFALRNQFIRVSGDFFPQTPVACTPFKGPRPVWGLIAADLQMDGIGLNTLPTLVPTGAELVVDGVWRLYEGPLGCGKEPPLSTLWYLEAQRIVQPNPLLFDGTDVPTAFGWEEGGSSTEPTPAPTPTATPTLTPTVDPNEELLLTREATPTLTPSPVATITIDENGNGELVSPTPQMRGTSTPSVPGAALTPIVVETATATPEEGEATPTPTVSNGGGGTPAPTAAPGTVVPATLAPTLPSGGYGGGDGYGGN